MSRTGIILFLFLIGVAVATSWLKSSTTTETKQEEEKLYAADFFMDNFRLLQYEDSGRLAYRLYGTRMEHFAEHNESVIDQPEIVIRPEDPAATWQVRAKRAVARSTAIEEITFTEDVVFRHATETGGEPLSLYTDHLLIRPAAEYIAADGPITITDGASTIKGAAMEANVRLGTFTLQQVKSRYAQ